MGGRAAERPESRRPPASTAVPDRMRHRGDIGYDPTFVRAGQCLQIIGEKFGEVGPAQLFSARAE